MCVLHIVVHILVLVLRPIYKFSYPRSRCLTKQETLLWMAASGQRVLVFLCNQLKRLNSILP